MGLGKVIGILFLILIIIAGVVGYDGYLTYTALTEEGVSTTDPTFTVSDDNTTVTISVEITTPTSGFIPKSLILVLTLTPSGGTAIVSEPQEIALGESSTISVDLPLSTSDTSILSGGGSLSVSASADITPALFGFEITQLTQTVDLGSHTVSV